MPAPRRLYIKANEIAAITGMCLRQAQYLVAMFREKGRTLEIGRNRHVAQIEAFAEYLSAQDGSCPVDKKRELQVGNQKPVQGSRKGSWIYVGRGACVGNPWPVRHRCRSGWQCGWRNQG